MMSFGGKILVIGVLNSVQARGQDFLIAAISGTPVLGLWSVANRLVRIIQEVGTSAVNAVAIPAFATMQDEPKRLFRAYEHALVTTGAVMFPALLLLAVTSPDLVPTLLGQQWTQTAQVAQVVTLTAAVGVFSYFDRTVLIAIGELRQETVLVAIGVVAQLGVVFALARAGLVAMALGLFGCALLTLPVRIMLLRRVAGMPVHTVLRPARVALAAVLMAVAVALVLQAVPAATPWVRIFAAFITALAVYPPALWLCARSVVRQLLVDLGRMRPRKAPDAVAAKAEEALPEKVEAVQRSAR